MQVTRSLRCALAMVCVLATACGPSRPALRQVELPDVSHADKGVQAQVRERYATLTARISDRRTSIPDLAAAYGQFGMLAQAAQFDDVAEACYLNAQTLAPLEMRWPYYLGHLYKSKGQPEKAADAFRRVLTLKPDDFPTLIWLGRLYIDQGKPDEANSLFTKALQLMPQSVAALAGLGNVDLARRDYAGAARHFEAALAIDPLSESLHAPLAAAYRAMGQMEKAQPHLRQWRNTDILLSDPLQDELDLLLESGLSYELRGVRALDLKDWPAAAAFFSKGLDLAQPGTALHRSLQHKLGTALFATGKVDEAVQKFDAVVDEAPATGIDESTAKAHYSLGILAAEKGRGKDAIEHLSAAVRYQPSYAEAHLGLADALRRDGRMADALREYDEAMAINPREPAGRLGHAIALVGLRRYRDARDWLAAAVQARPDQPQFAHALARVLVTAPDPQVRNVEQAAAIVQELFNRDKSISVGETMAMTLAESGDYQQAAAIQRGLLDAARQAHLDASVRRMEENLRLYERRQPCRVAWRNDEPVFLPTGAAK